MAEYFKQLLQPVNGPETPDGKQIQLVLAGHLSPVERVTLFRPIHYLGSKLRLLEPIRDALNALDGKRGKACDLFAGSGTVAFALSAERQVVAADIQEYSRVICSAILNGPAKIQHTAFVANHALLECINPLIEHEEQCIQQALLGDPMPICDLLEFGCLVAKERNIAGSLPRGLDFPLIQSLRALKKEQLDSRTSLITRHFGGIYFSYRQAAILDSLLTWAHSQALESRDLLIAALLSTTSEVVNTVGKQFAQPIRPRDKEGKPKLHLIKKIAEDRAKDICEIYFKWLERYQANAKHRELDGHRVIRGDYIDVLRNLASDVTVVYADPPYTRDHYSRFYHVLETICLQDDPQISTVKTNGVSVPSRGIYRADRHQSPFCIKSQAPKAFSKLFAEVRARSIPLVLSYSPFAANSEARPRLLSIAQIEELASQHFRTVKVVSIDIAHSKLNTTTLNVEKSTTEAEVLISCRP